MTEQEVLLTPASAPSPTALNYKSPVVQFDRRDGTYGLMYAYASTAHSQDSLRGTYSEGVPEFVFWKYDGAETPPAGMRLVASVCVNTVPQASEFALMPQGTTASTWRQTLGSTGYVFQEWSGYLYDAAQPQQDAVALHRLVISSNQVGGTYMNNFYSSNPAVIAAKVAQGWTDLGAIGYAMPVYDLVCSYDQATGKLVLQSVVQNAPGEEPGSFRVGQGQDNLIRITRAAGSTFSLVNISFNPNDPAVLDLLTHSSTKITVRDNNTSPTQQVYDFTVYGQLADGTRVQSDPKIINRVGEN